jgi:hypothetical protein
LWPDVYKNQEYSVSKAKNPITDYKKASGLPEGLAELAVYYCEQGIGFSNAVGLDDEGYYDALVRMCIHGAVVLRDPILDKDKDPSFSAKLVCIRG